MDIYFLDSDLQERIVLDSFTSLIWTKRYYTYGDFELYLSASKELTDVINSCKYIMRDDDESVMIIENIQINTDVENGDYYTITGRSLESILTRRVVWTQTNLSVNDPAQAIYTLLEENVTDPEIEARMIPNFVIDDTFSAIGSLRIQMTGTELAEAITNICKSFGIGWKITKDDSDMVFSLYQRGAVDVTFSEEFDNLITSQYYQNSENFKNVALVAGEGEGTARKRYAVEADPSAEGLERREVYIDARDISSNSGEIPEVDYNALLATRGEQKLLDEFAETHGFEGEVEPNTTYKYKRDYDLGNIVTVANGYGVEATPRIIEIIECWNEDGYSVVPTFEKWEV